MTCHLRMLFYYVILSVVVDDVYNLTEQDRKCIITKLDEAGMLGYIYDYFLTMDTPDVKIIIEIFFVMSFSSIVLHNENIS